jgi:branched-chain amino acid transport system ATP-binding protein
MSETILECTQLTRYFGGLAAVNQLSFSVQRGQIFGIAGPNGAGKTTLFNLLSGHVMPSSGVIRFVGREIQGAPPHQVCHLGIARTFQAPLVFGGGTVAENALVGSYFGKRAGFPGLSFDRASRRRADEALEFAGLTGKRNWPADMISIFEKKQLMVASAMATNPQLMLLDEPVGGLNHAEIDAFIALIRRVQQAGVTVILIEHVMRALMALSDRVLIMHHGEKLSEGTPQEIRADAQVIQVYLGRQAGAG